MKCNACLAELGDADSEHTLLWDGKYYCKECLERELPGLFEFARQNTCFEEKAPWEPKRIFLRHAFLFLLLGLFFGAVMAHAAFPSLGVLGVFQGICAGLLVAVFAGIVQIPPYLWMTAGRLPTVHIADGHVVVSRGRRNPRQVVSCTLQSVRWRLGKVKQDTLLRRTFIPNEPAMILVLPERKGHVACGWTRDTRSVLEAFLHLAQIDKV